MSASQIVGAVDKTFGRGAKGFDWGTISGIALSDRGDIAVADGANSRIAVLLPTGGVRFVLGREGSEPGELSLPCCLAFSPTGELWTREGGNSRYSVFRFAGDSAVLDHTLRIDHPAARAWASTTFDRSGRLIDVGVEVDARSGALVIARFHRDQSRGTTRERHLISPPPLDKLAVFSVGGTRGDSSTHQFFYAPYGPEHLLAHGPGGEWAEAVSSSYVVTWRDPAGSVIHTLKRNLDGARLSRAERADATKSLKEQSVRAGRKLPFKVPRQKPPLRALLFDSGGRLWVERNTESGTDRIADIYEHGRLVSVVRWPADVRLDVGFVQPEFALGVRRDDLDVEHLVRLVFRPGVERVSSASTSR